MNTLSVANRQEALYRHLGRERTPFATAELSGAPIHPNLSGLVEFYATPAGMLILAELQGLPRAAGDCRRSAAYELCLKGGSASAHTYRCAYLPILYEKEGSAWCSVVTAKLSIADLREKQLVLCTKAEGNEHHQVFTAEIAEGTVLFPQPIARKQAYLGSSAVVS